METEDTQSSRKTQTVFPSRARVTTYIYLATVLSIIYAAWMQFDVSRFYGSYDFIPLQEPVVLEAGYENEYSFDIDYPGPYKIHMLFYRGIDFDSLMNLTGMNIFEHNVDDTLLGFTWTISDATSSTLDSGTASGNADQISSNNEYIHRSIGRTSLECGTGYRLTVVPAISRHELEGCNPTVQLKSAQEEYYDYGWRPLRPMLFAVFMILVSLVTFAVNAIRSSIRRRNT